MELISGWLPDLSVRTFVQQYCDVVSALEFVLIRSLDSNPNVGGLPFSAELPDRDIRCQTPFVVSGSVLLNVMIPSGLFTGFDEIWILDRVPTSSPSPESSIVAPTRLDEDPVSAGLAEWLSTPGVRMGLGDGYGLNFVGKDIRLLRAFDLVAGAAC